MDDATPPAERTHRLAVQIPAIPPDETPGLTVLRELSAEEATQLSADTALVRSVARSAPYQRAAASYEQLFAAADAVKTKPDHRPTARGAITLGRGLSAVAHEFRELPTGLAETLSKNLPDDAEAADRFARAAGDLGRDASYRLTTRLHALKPERLQVAREETGIEVVAAEDAASSWGNAAELEQTPDVLGVFTTIEAALEAAALLVARSLIEQREILDAACRRIAALDGEVFQGASCTLELAPGDDVEALTITNLSPLPVEDVTNVQYAIARAEALLSSTDRDPATRGPEAMTSETVAAVTATQRVGPDPAPTNVADEPTARDRPIDMIAVIGHLQLGALRLERAWSRALKQDDITTQAGEWTSLLQSLIGELQHLDDALPEEDRELDLPPTLEEILALLDDAVEPSDRRHRVAQVVAISDLVALVPALSEPTNGLRDDTARRVEWFSSGAFANVRANLDLVAALLDDGRPVPPLSPRRLAVQARLRADPLAEVVHLARAFSGTPAEDLPADGTHERAVVDRVRDLARQIAAGDPVAADQAILCAVGAREILDEGGAR